MALLLMVFGVTIYVSIRNALMQEFDDSLLATVETLMASTEIEDGEVIVEFEPNTMRGVTGMGAPTYFQIWLDGGGVLMRSASLGDDELPRFSGKGNGIATKPTDLPNGLPGHAAAVRFVPTRDDDLGSSRADESAEMKPITLVVARDTAAIGRRMVHLALLLAGAGAILMAAASGIVFIIVRRGLAPVDSVGDQIAAMNPDDLTGRVSDAHLPAEIEPMVKRLNTLLDRLQMVFDRERSFTSNVAHELRTPLAGIRSIIEVAQLVERSPQAYRQTMTDCMAIIETMQGMIEILILLARLDAGQITFADESIELAELVASCWSTVATHHDAAASSFENRLPQELACRSDRQWLTMVCINLLKNAREYVEDHGRIWVTGRAVDGRIEIEFANTGCKLTTDEAQHVFERFWRADTSRTDTGVHFGLGLALVDRLITALGGTVACDVTQENVFVVRLELSAQ